jgi:general secretion pathway protein K
VRLYHMDRKSNREAGIALITVLLLLALLTILATAVQTLSVSQRRAVERFSEAARDDVLADSALRLVLVELSAPKTQKDPLDWSTPRRLELFHRAIEVEIERDAGRIDLNTADPKLLFAFFAANGWTEERALSLVARIEDWKDVDDNRRNGGAETADYTAAGRSYGPRNGPFESVDELRQVLGGEDFTPELLESMTVFSHLRVPVQNAVKVPVMRALSWADQHRLGNHPWLTSGDAEVSTHPIAGPTSLIGEVIRLRACLSGKRARRCRVAIVRPTGHFERPYQVFLWQTRFRAE